jgi:hypothetical protein
MNLKNFRSIAIVILALTALFTSKYSHAAVVKQAYCTISSGIVYASVYAGGNATKIRFAVKSGYNFVYYNEKYVTAFSTVGISERLGRLDVKQSYLAIWSDDGLVNKTIPCG